MTQDLTTPETSTEALAGNALDDLLNTHFAGKVVRKDLTKLIKEGANVPVYVLEYLLGMYCASNDEATIQNGLVSVKRILTENYVRPDEAEKVKSKVRESGTYKVIDKVTVKLNEKRDVYEALAVKPGREERRDFRHLCAPVREAAGGRHLVHRDAEIPLRRSPEGVALHGDRPQADPDAEHGHGGAVRGAQGVHR
jgi:hypothetical protein